MITELGKVRILINGRERSYNSIELVNHNRYFSVKKRYKLICNIPEQLDKDINIKCILEINKHKQVESGVETGENLALISFWWDENKLSIGTKGDIKGVNYSYFKNAIKMSMQKNMKQVIFYVAWLKMTDPEREDIYTWFGADPTYDE